LADDIARRSGLPHKSVSAEALALLAGQSWRGNIRELRNVLEQATLMTDDSELLPPHFAQALGLVSAPAAVPVPTVLARAAVVVPAPSSSPVPAPLRPLHEQVQELECRAIAQALAATAGNRMAAARLLQMSRAALYDRLARHPELLEKR
jgi:DNA-binding NtrC family response regulator